jgi:hypothetical protein
MSYSNGFAGSSPKFALMEDAFHVIVIVTAGKRRTTVGLIGIFRPANLDSLGHYVIMVDVKLEICMKFICYSSKPPALTHPIDYYSR